MFAGQVALVTGGARGIGLSTGIALARRGARVVLADIDGPVAVQAAAALHGTGHLGLPLDVRDEDSCRIGVAATIEQFGKVDILVNSAGVAILGEFVSLTAAEQDLQIEVNLHGVVRMSRLVLPGMLTRGSGSIVNLASASGLIPAPHAAVYSATKHAVVGLTEALRWELRRRGVRVSAVLPTVVTTEMAEGLRTPGLPVVSVERVAAAVVRVLRRRRPRAVTLVPRWFAAAAFADRVSPGWVRDVARRLFRVADGSEDRQSYLDRVGRQLDDGTRL
jgi:NAD(P)-dependent dehydrogenase (short-subunit alcohol dehydrogenase family)